MFKGSLVALVTPFDNDNCVNFRVLGQLVDFHLKNGTDGLVILGTTSESATLDFEEEARIAKFVIERVNKKIPVIVGSGSNNTQEAIWQSMRFEQMGADGLLVVTPYYNKCNEDGLYLHYQAIADAVKIPVILYNVPSRTGVNISFENLLKLKKIPNIIGIKEASGNIAYMTKVATILDDDFIMFSGNDDLVLVTLALGGSGVISVMANSYPKMVHEMCAAYFQGNEKRARELQLAYLDIIHNMFIEVNPIPVKNALNYQGFKVGKCRLPLGSLTSENENILRKSMEKMGYQKYEG